MIRIEQADIENISLIRSLSHRIWPEAYGKILSKEQISYMLDMMYNEEALMDQINQKKHRFIIAFDDNDPVGFASYSQQSRPESHLYRLHKLYVLPGIQGKGLGKHILQYIELDIVPAGAKSLELNVNKNNPALQFYHKMGFKITREEKIDIGQGFYMDDYVMETSLPGKFVP
jgi:diamine N-acetyltransferase